MDRVLASSGVRSAGTLLVILGIAMMPVFTQPAFAQNDKRELPQRIHAEPSGGAPPRASDGHPDLSGVWFPNGAGMDLEAVAPNDTAIPGAPTADPDARRQFDPKVTPEERPPFQPWAAAKIKAMTPAERELGKSSVKCAPRGVQGMFMATPYPIQLVQTPGQLVQLMELNNNFRVVHTDGRAHAKDPEPGFYGDETAHWDGDTLVIDTIALDENTWNDLNAWFHSDQEHVIERLSRPSMNYLIYQVTIEDPKVLTKPWTSVQRKWSLNHGKLDEYYCTRNDEVQQYQLLKKEEDGKKSQ